jgi:AraC-like DNA-binding protein
VGDVCRQQAILGQIVWLLFRDLDGFQLDGVPVPCSRSHSQVLTLLDNLVSYNNYTLADIAEAIDYSPRNVSRLIRNTYHMSLKELRVKYALDTAKKLLASENLSMDEVAVRSNFKSTAAMRGAFRKYLQTSPTEYRETLIRREDHDTETADRH